MYTYTLDTKNGDLKKKKKSTKRSQLPERRAYIKYSIDINSNNLSIAYGFNSHIHQCACEFWLKKKERKTIVISLIVKLTKKKKKN